MFICLHRKFLTILCMFFCVAITYAYSLCVSAESKDRYRLSTYYCELEVGSDIHMYLYDSEDEEERLVSKNEVKWYTDSDDIVITESGDAIAVKCSGKKKSYANIYAEYKGTTYRCEVLIFAKGKYKSDYKIVLPKNVEYFRVGKTYKLSVKGSGKKKVKWYVGTEDDYYEDTSCKYARIDNKGNLTILACKCDPDDLYVYAKIGKMIIMEHIYTQPVRNKKEKKALKKLIDKTNLSAKNKKKAMSHYNKYCWWDGRGHLAGIHLKRCGIKGSLALKGFVSLKSLCLEANDIKRIDLSYNKELMSLDMSYNCLKSIDLSYTPQIYYLDLRGNKIKKVNFTNNHKLEILLLSENPITKLDTLNGCSNLEELEINNCVSYDHSLQMIDLSCNYKLRELNACYNYGMKTISLPSGDALKSVFLENCGLEELDISGCEGLIWALLYGNQLKRVIVPKTLPYTLSCDTNIVFEYMGEDYTSEEFAKKISRCYFGELYWWYDSEDEPPFPGDEEDDDWY